MRDDEERVMRLECVMKECITVHRDVRVCANMREF